MVELSDFKVCPFGVSTKHTIFYVSAKHGSGNFGAHCLSHVLDPDGITPRQRKVLQSGVLPAGVKLRDRKKCLLHECFRLPPALPPPAEPAPVLSALPPPPAVCFASSSRITSDEPNRTTAADNPTAHAIIYEFCTKLTSVAQCAQTS
eukprot:gb/GEZN01023242.1/.p2 GENE.gb/GEZN01023242.1/~~gb/GEZN01023242.1/.p2  ORF type:complete len:148 (+),score=14.93 gb/GEZN01023242.1/:26-469(+)